MIDCDRARVDPRMFLEPIPRKTHKEEPGKIQGATHRTVGDGNSRISIN